jgi:hypothetical protein
MPLDGRRCDIVNTPDMYERGIRRSVPARRRPRVSTLVISPGDRQYLPLRSIGAGRRLGALTRVPTSLYSRLPGRTDPFHFIRSYWRLPQESPVFPELAPAEPFSRQNRLSVLRFSRQAIFPAAQAKPPKPRLGLAGCRGSESAAAPTDTRGNTANPLPPLPVCRLALPQIDSST